MSDWLSLVAPVSGLGGGAAAVFMLRRDFTRLIICCVAAFTNYRVEATKDGIVFEPANQRAKPTGDPLADAGHSKLSKRRVRPTS